MIFVMNDKRYFQFRIFAIIQEIKLMVFKFWLMGFTDIVNVLFQRPMMIKNCYGQ